MKYGVEIKEILRRNVEVEADTFGEALMGVMDKYRNGEIVLNADDFDEVYYNSVNEGN